MNNRFFDFLSEVVCSWNTKQLLLSRGIGSSVTGIFMATIIFCADINNATKWDIYIAKGYWLVFAISLSLFGVYQINKLLRTNKQRGLH